MFSSFVLENGQNVKTPWLDGVLERGLRLAEKWVRKNPKLDSVPQHLLVLEAIGAVDVMRHVEGFKKVGISKKVALHYAHSHLPDTLMYAGVVYALAYATYLLEQPPDDPTATPSFLGLSGDASTDPAKTTGTRPTEKDLSELYEYKVDFPELIGPEATKHLIQAILAYDRWAREHHKTRRPKPS
jgi:hypothetical protein